MKRLIYISFLLAIILPLAYADTVVIAGGSTEACIINTPDVNSCFSLSQINANQTVGGSGTVYQPVDNNKICNYSRSFLKDHYNDGILSITDSDILNLKLPIDRDLKIKVSKEDLLNILYSCPKLIGLEPNLFSIAGLKVTKGGLYILILSTLFIVIFFIIALASYKSKRIIFFLKKRKELTKK